MTNKFKSGQIMNQTKDPPKTLCCLHKNIIPLEYTFARVSHPNGYKADPLMRS